MTARAILPPLAVLFLCTLPLTAQPDTRAAAEIDLQRKLNAPLDLTLDNVELRQAIQTISDKAHIPLIVEPASYDCLPYGNTTKVSASFRNSFVKDCIEEVVSRLGLEMVVSGPNVMIRPSAPLRRIGRRAEWNELELLAQVRKTQLPKVDLDWTKDLRSLLGRPELLVKISDNPNHPAAMAAVQSQLPCPVAQALDTYAGVSKMIWTVKGGLVFIESPKEWIQGQLERPLVIHFDNAPLKDVVDELAYDSRIRFEPEPGLYAAFPMVTLNSQDSSVQSALDALAGSAFIGYEVREDRIYLFLNRKNVATPASTSPIVGRIAVPLNKDNLSLDLFVRESDLPPEVAALCRKRLAETIEALRKNLQEPHPPTTAPVPPPPAATATQPK